MKTGFSRTFAAAVVALLFAAIPSFSATITYSSSAAWTAATSTSSTIQFTGIAPSGSLVNYNNSTGLVSSGVTFTGQCPGYNCYYTGSGQYQLAVVDSLYSSPYYNFGGGAVLRGPVNDRATSGTAVPYIHVVLPSGTTAIASDLGTVSPYGLTFTITLADGEYFTVNTPGSASTAFFGLTTDSPIAYVDFSLPGSSYTGSSYAVLKDFSLGTASAGGSSPETPEACTLILIGTGLVLLRYMRRRGAALKWKHA